MKLNLGCCNVHIPGFVNVDRVEPADQIVDLSEFWPWEDSSVEHIVAHDIIEHLPNKIRTMNELHRVLVPGGSVSIVVPTTDGTGAWQDPTHISYWNRPSFWYYTAGNAHRERFGDSYGITARFDVLGEGIVRGEGIYSSIVHLNIMLKAVK